MQRSIISINITVAELYISYVVALDFEGQNWVCLASAYYLYF